MATHRHIDLICLVATLLALALCAALISGEALGIEPTHSTQGYEQRLFDTTRVHTIDIVIDDWAAFLETAESEEYSLCSVVIDGETIGNVGIRGKGNTSLSRVSSMGSDRYSFKIEFDQYDSTKSYHGLDKLSLNNIIQDNTYMKDYLSYRMMQDFGVPAPLCSYAYITVNGDAWGLYLAVEAVEESFLQRNYGSGFGELYKPDSMDMGGGRGNGRDFELPVLAAEQPGTAASADRNGGTAPTRDTGRPFAAPGESRGGMGSAETKLQYIDDDPASYSAIFSSAKTHITEEDQARLIASLKQLTAQEDLEQVLIIEDVLRYFVVHSYVVNGDSYTGSMIHNYYLYEESGQLSMIPWDYNLAFGTFQGGSASDSVNDDIDAVLSDRPMQAWIFSDEVYSDRYRALYAQFLEEVDVQGIIARTYELIAPYVEKDPTAFCTYTEFQTGVEALKEFCALRSESAALQLAGSSQTVDASALDLSDMGTMNGSTGGRSGVSDQSAPFGEAAFGGGPGLSGDTPAAPGAGPGGHMQPPGGSTVPAEGDAAQLPGISGAVAPRGTAEDDAGEQGAVPSFGNAPFHGSTVPAGMISGGETDPSSRSAAILLGVSALLLAVGLAAAFKFRR